MHVAKIPLLFLAMMVTHVQAQINSFHSVKEMMEQLQLSSQDSWAIDGGVFRPFDSNTEVPSGEYQLLVKDRDNNIKSYAVNMAGPKKMSKLENTIVVDRSGPQILISWRHVMDGEGGPVIGPNSQLTWRVKDGNADSTVLMINNRVVDQQQPIQFDSDAKKIIVKAVDEFDNSSVVEQSLITDFDGPNISWKLLEPAIKKDGLWLAGEQAQIVFEAQDSSGVAKTWLNQEKQVNSQASILVNNNDQLTAVDALGNSKTQSIEWQVDDNKPELYIEIDKQSIDAQKKRFLVKTQQNIYLDVSDDSGLKYAKYFSTEKRWEPLPQSFTFRKRGRNSIVVMAEDQFGNVLRKKLKFRAKKHGK